MKPASRWSAAALAAALVAASAAAVEVREVRIESGGPARVDEAAARSRLSVRPGEEFERARIMRDVRALEQSGRYASVEARAEKADGGVAVIYSLTPRPRVEMIEVTGADRLGNAKVGELIGLGPGDLVDEAVMAAGVRRVQEEYFKKYYPDARVTWRLEPNERTGGSRVFVNVREGPQAMVREIRFVGNTVLTARELELAMRQRRYRWYHPMHWFTEAGRLDSDMAEGDVYTLRRQYADRGYLDARVTGPEIEFSGARRLRLTYRIEEGRTYRLGTVSLTGITVFPTTEVQRLVRLAPGLPASVKAIDEAAEAVMDYYGNRGYIRTDVDPQIDPDAQAGVANVTLRVREGRIAYVRDIRIRGNVTTKDKVIRRELRVYPGEKYNRARVKTSERRLMNLGYFSNVRGYPEGTPEPEKADLVFDVEEQRMGQAGAGVGFSSIDRVAGYLELSHGNVDLSRWPPAGGGQKLRLRGTIGTRRQDVELSFTEPYFLDRQLALGVDLFHRENRYDSREYDIRRTGGEVSLAKPLDSFNRVTLAYRLEDVDIYDVDEDASQVIKDEEGRRLESSSTLALAHDSRNEPWRPSRGNYSRAAVGFAGGPLQGDTEWYRLDLRSSQYIPLWLQHVLLLRGHAGVIEEYGDSDRVPIFNRYFLGGPYNLRAFDYREVGPVDENEEPVGGRTLGFASMEYFVPVFSKLRLSAYVEAGQVWEDAYGFDLELNSGYGVGLYLDIPYLPLRFFYAWPIESEDYNRNKDGQFSFIIGYSF